MSAEPLTIVTGFEPFLGRGRNRSWEVVRRLASRPGLETAQLPVDFVRLPQAIAALLAREPAALLMVGEARRGKVAVEQVALNVADCEDPDNDGAVAHDRPLALGAPLAVRAAWDARAVAATLRDAKIPAEVSFHAGTYACNAALYLAVSQAHATRVGFLHVPRAPWPRGPRLSTLIAAVELAARALTPA